MGENHCIFFNPEPIDFFNQIEILITLAVVTAGYRMASLWHLSGPLAMVAVITEQKVVSAILRHLEKHGEPTSVHARDPPAA